MAKGRWPTLHTFGMLCAASGDAPNGSVVLYGGPVEPAVRKGFNDYGLFTQSKIEESYEGTITELVQDVTAAAEALDEVIRLSPDERDFLWNCVNSSYMRQREMRYVPNGKYLEMHLHLMRKFKPEWPEVY